MQIVLYKTLFDSDTHFTQWTPWNSGFPSQISNTESQPRVLRLSPAPYLLIWSLKL